MIKFDLTYLKLPVMQLNYGDSLGAQSWIEYSLGPLKCSGKKYFYPSEIKTASFTFKIGMTYFQIQQIWDKRWIFSFGHSFYAAFVSSNNQREALLIKLFF